MIVIHTQTSQSGEMGSLLAQPSGDGCVYVAVVARFTGTMCARQAANEHNGGVSMAYYTLQAFLTMLSFYRIIFLYSNSALVSYLHRHHCRCSAPMVPTVVVPLGRWQRAADVRAAFALPVRNTYTVRLPMPRRHAAELGAVGGVCCTLCHLFATSMYQISHLSSRLTSCPSGVTGLLPFIAKRCAKRTGRPNRNGISALLQNTMCSILTSTLTRLTTIPAVRQHISTCIRWRA